MAGEEVVTEETPKTEFVPVEDYKRVEALVNGQQATITSLQNTINGLHAMVMDSRKAPPTREPAIEDVSDADLDNALLEGGGGGKIKKAIKAEAQRLIKDHIAPLQQLGLQTMGEFAAEMAKNHRDEKGTPSMPHYARFKDEIDSLVAGSAPQLRVNPRTYIEAHNIVVGRHAAELIAEAKAEAVAAKEPGKKDPPTPNGRTGRTSATGGVPAFEEVFSPDVVKSLGGQSADDFAKSLGYTGWEDYYNKTIK